MGICKLNDKKRGFTRENVTALSYTRERSVYALQNAYLEFQSFEAGTYYIYAEVDWDRVSGNARARVQDICVNCYGPDAKFIADESSLYDQ